MPCAGVWVRGSEAEARPFVVESRPLRLRTGLDPARLRELDDDPEIAGFLRKTARLQERRE